MKIVGVPESTGFTLALTSPAEGLRSSLGINAEDNGGSGIGTMLLVGSAVLSVSKGEDVRISGVIKDEVDMSLVRVAVGSIGSVWASIKTDGSDVSVVRLAVGDMSLDTVDISSGGG